MYMFLLSPLQSSPSHRAPWAVWAVVAGPWWGGCERGGSRLSKRSLLVCTWSTFIGRSLQQGGTKEEPGKFRVRAK